MYGTGNVKLADNIEINVFWKCLLALSWLSFRFFDPYSVP